MATITFESFIPAKCCTAPESPIAIYSSGAITFPVWPTCISLEQYPESTAALEAPTAALPNASARSQITEKFYLLLTPLPPDTTIFAVVKSGLLESDFYSFTNSVIFEEGSFMSYTSALLLPAGSYSKEEALKVRKLIFWLLLTLVRAFPAQVDLTKVFSSIIYMTSVMGCERYFPAILGITSLPKLLLSPTQFLQLYFECRVATVFETISLNGLLVLTAMIFCMFQPGMFSLIDLTTSVQSSANISMCCFYFSLLAADKTLSVLLKSFLPLCSARTRVVKVFLGGN